MIFREPVRSPWSTQLMQLPSRTIEAGSHHDVCIVGGGIVGLTTAYLLARAGLDVVLLEAHTLGSGESGRSTAHLSSVSDRYPDTLIRKFDRETSQTFAEGLAFAVRSIEETVAAERMDCDFARLPAYLLASTPDEMARLSAIAAAARQIEMNVASTPAPTHVRGALGALAFPDQARIDPMRYMAGLARAAIVAGVAIHEDTRVVEVGASSPHVVRVASGAQLVADQVVIAAHVPFNNRILLHTKQAAYRTYAIALAVPRDSIPDALYWDLADPYHYVRLMRDEREAASDLLIVGGEDHKTGHASRVADPFAALGAFAYERFGITGETVYQWSGQIMEPVDGLPLVGENPGTHTEYVATGFAGDGMTGGTLAAHVIAERIQGRSTRWDEVLAPARFSAAHDVRDFLTENVALPAHLVGDRLRPETEERPLALLHAGEGGLFKLGGRRLAVSRLANGHFAALQPACSHLGCHVHWNGIEASWDCPCHGSRFAQNGDVLNGPASIPLPEVPLEEVLTESDKETQRPTIGLAEDWAAT